MEHQFEVRVYYEDTDCMGVVYHANYLRFFERARTEFLGSVGPSVQQWAERGLMFPIYSINAIFRAPARLGDLLVVTSHTTLSSPFRMTFAQQIRRKNDPKVLVEAKVDVVCTDLGGKLKEFPDGVLAVTS